MGIEKSSHRSPNSDLTRPDTILPVPLKTMFYKLLIILVVLILCVSAKRGSGGGKQKARKLARNRVHASPSVGTRGRETMEELLARRAELRSKGQDVGKRDLQRLERAGY